MGRNIMLFSYAFSKRALQSLINQKRSEKKVNFQPISKVRFDLTYSKTLLVLTSQIVSLITSCFCFCYLHSWTSNVHFFQFMSFCSKFCTGTGLMHISSSSKFGSPGHNGHVNQNFVITRSFSTNSEYWVVLLNKLSLSQRYQIISNQQNRLEINWNMKWNELKWNEMKWNEMKWWNDKKSANLEFG